MKTGIVYTSDFGHAIVIKSVRKDTEVWNSQNCECALYSVFPEKSKSLQVAMSFLNRLHEPLHEALTLHDQNQRCNGFIMGGHAYT